MSQLKSLHYICILSALVILLIFDFLSSDGQVLINHRAAQV